MNLASVRNSLNSLGTFFRGFGRREVRREQRQELQPEQQLYDDEDEDEDEDDDWAEDEVNEVNSSPSALFWIMLASIGLLGLANDYLSSPPSNPADARAVTKAPAEAAAAAGAGADSSSTAETAADVYMNAFLIVAWTVVGFTTIRAIWGIYNRIRGHRNAGANAAGNEGRINNYLAALREMVPGRRGYTSVHGESEGGGGADLRLALAVMRREFSPEDYDLLSQLDQHGRGGGGGMAAFGEFGGGAGAGLEEGTIHRFPVRSITAAEVTAAKGRVAATAKSSRASLLSASTPVPVPVPVTKGGKNDKDKDKDRDSPTVAASTSSDSLVRLEEEGCGGGGGASGSGDFLCSVCLAPYEVGDRVRTILCLHSYHQDCIDPWLRQHNDCPICKTKLC